MRHEFPVAGPLRVQASIRSSDLAAAATDVDQVSVEVDGAQGAEDIRVELVGDVLRIEVPSSARRLFGGGARHRITVRVPERSSLDVASGSGDVTASGPWAAGTVRSGSGDVDLAHVDDAEVATGSGDITVASLITGTFTAGSGDIDVGAASDVVRARSGSGDLVMGSVSELDAVTASGDVLIKELRGRANVRTASGDLVVRRGEHGELQAKTASGDISVRVVEGTAALLACSSVSGSVTSALEPGPEPGPDEPALVVRASTLSGNVTVQRTT